MIEFALEMPALVDEMDDSVSTAYGAIPERLYAIDRDGKVAYKGGMGVMFFKPLKRKAANESYLASS